MMGCLARGLIVSFVFATLCGSATAQDQYFDSKGVKIRYIVVGQGEPVVLIHGFTANLDANWRVPGIIHNLAANNQVIALDCRGHGKSDKPHDVSSYGREMVEDVIRLMDHLKIKRAHIAGYSMGAMIAAKLVTVHPDRVLSVILGGQGGYHDSPAMEAFTEGWARSLEGKAGNSSLATSEGGNARRLAMTTDSAALAAVVRSWKALATNQQSVKAIKVPMIAIVGSQDPAKMSVEETKSWKPDMKVVVIEGANHMSAVISADLIRAMREFLAENKSKSSAVQKNRARLTAVTTPIAAATI